MLNSSNSNYVTTASYFAAISAETNKNQTNVNFTTQYLQMQLIFQCKYKFVLSLWFIELCVRKNDFQMTRKKCRSCKCYTNENFINSTNLKEKCVFFF